MAKLAMDLHDEIKRLIRDPKYGSSDRARDQARTKLKRLGLIEFDRKAWEWVVLPAGRAALEPADD
ncbi:hypothetical protein ACTDI4_17085 [Mesorhizobium sp. PUT5]|uniref:hypothetical protein n=1 Tax=Mesorhizobium sp. PUT5 TaxID=3454629 RepID=UPI003FA4C0DD